MQSINTIEFVAFDTETTGIYPTSDGLVELAGVRFSLEKGKIAYFQTLINPQRIIPRRVSAIHGITNTMVKDAPSAEQAIIAFLQFSENALFVAHNARFDVDFLGVHALRFGLDLPKSVVFDTLRLAKRLRPDLPSYRLEALTNEFGIEASEYHRALADSYSCMDVFRQLCSPETSAIESYYDLCDAHGPQILFHEAVRAITEPDPIYQPLAKAMHAKQAIWIEYTGGYGEREITPISLFEKGKQQYMEAICHLDDTRKTFRLDRIEKILPTPSN